jgi:acyl carrier protein
MNDQVIQIVSRILNVPAEQIGLDSSPGTLPHWDSMRHIELILALEQEFGVQFQAIVLSEQLNVRQLCEELKRLKDRPGVA